MTPSGRFQLLVWRLRLQLRKSELLRWLVSRIRALLPDTRERHLRGEVGFWDRWLATQGLHWPDDYEYRLDPSGAVHEPLASILDSMAKTDLEILDVGAGPLTVIGKTHPGKRLSITATDVLAREYNALLDKFGVSPPVRTQFAEAEKLREQLAGRHFDIVHAQNSLDHSADPMAGIEEMLALTRPGGLVVLIHEENEGQNELYYALHKWDFACEDGHFVVGGPGPDGPRRDVTEMLAGKAEVECWSDGECVYVAVAKKAQAPISSTRSTGRHGSRAPAAAATRR